MTIIYNILLALAFFSSSAFADDLKDYVQRAGTYSQVNRLHKQNVESVEIEPVTFTSHRWRGVPWRHLLLIVRPAVIKDSRNALLVIGGGNNTDGEAADLPKRMASDEAKIAIETAASSGLVTAVLFNVPNQPLFDGKSEDVLLAMSLAQYRNTGDGDWPLLFPMVTSAIRAMDLLSDHISKELTFIVTGASKRGWTTYLTGAADERVIAIAPAVFEMVDIPAQIKLARERYGSDSEMIKSYTALRLTDDLDSPPMQKLRSWIDPISYERIAKLPKLILLGSNDPYWVVDAHSFYLPRFEEPKLVTMLPNVGHGVLAPQAGRKAIEQFVNMVENNSYPQVSWKAQKSVSVKLTVHSDKKIARVRVWIADSPTSDFRGSQFHEGGTEIVNSSDAEVGWAKGSAPWRVGFAQVWVEGYSSPFSSEAFVLH